MVSNSSASVPRSSGYLTAMSSAKARIETRASASLMMGSVSMVLIFAFARLTAVRISSDTVMRLTSPVTTFESVVMALILSGRPRSWGGYRIKELLTPLSIRFMREMMFTF